MKRNIKWNSLLKLDLGPAEFERVLHGNEFRKWEGQFNAYVLDVKGKGTDLGTFWLSCLEHCDLMLNLIYATRTGSRELYLSFVGKSYHGLLLMIA